MRRLISPLLILTCCFIWSCKKTPIEIENGINNDATVNSEVSAIKDNPTSISAGMMNYESYFLSSKDNKIHGYIISTPLDYDPKSTKKYPLLVFMHGDGEKPGSKDYDLSKLKYHGPHKEIFSKGRSFPAVVVSIQMAKGEGVVNPAVIKELIDVITGQSPVPKQGKEEGNNNEEEGNNNNNNNNKAAVGLGKYNIDLNRIHLTGLSQGGNGAYKTAFTYPDFFASISVFSGYTGSQYDMSKIKIPVYIRHNSNDPTVNVANAYHAQTWINAAGPVQPVDLLVFNSSGHDAWSTEYGRKDKGNVYDWHWAISRNSGSSNTSTPPVVEPTNSSLAVTTYSPALNSVYSVNGYGMLTLLFNGNIKRNTGIIEIKNLTDGTSTQVNTSWSMVRISGNQLVVYPVELAKNKKYAVRIQRGAITDSAGEPFAGIADDKTWAFSVGNPPVTPTPTPVPPAPAKDADPVVTAPGSSAFILSSFTPADNSTISKPSNGYIHLKLQFSSSVQRGSGLIEVKNLTDNTSFKVYANWGMVRIDGKTVDIYPVPVSSKKKYAVTIAGNAFKDSKNNYFTGISDTKTLNFSVK